MPLNPPAIKSAIVAALSVSAVVAVLYLAYDVLLLVFAAVLLGVLLSGLAQWLRRKTGLGYKSSLAAVMVAIVLSFVLFAVLVAPRVGEQAGELSQKLPEAFASVQSKLQETEWGRSLIQYVSSDKLAGSAEKIASRTTRALSGALGFLAAILIVFFVGVYTALEPSTYKRGFLTLIPRRRCPRATEVLDQLHRTLKWWLVGKFASMVVVGVLTTLGLWLLGSPLALVLGAIAAILTFIPNFGPVLSALPAILLGFLEGPDQAAYVAGLYVGIQIVESYLITPLIQKKTVELPPALIISAQVLMGVLFGLLGVALATPLTAAGLVLVRTLYVEDVLGKK